MTLTRILFSDYSKTPISYQRNHLKPRLSPDIVTLTSTSTSTHITTQMSKHPPKKQTLQPTPFKYQCTTDHRTHQNHIPVFSPGLIFNLTILFVEIRKNVLVWAKKTLEKYKENSCCPIVHWVNWIRKVTVTFFRMSHAYRQ